MNQDKTTISKRRIRLGSGLHIAKLTGTIEALRIAEGRSAALICSDPEDVHAWIHLDYSKVSSLPGEWLLTAGFPFVESPAKIIKDAGIILPSETLVVNYEYGIFLSLKMGGITDPKDIATLIVDIMNCLQGITSDTAIEVALEDS